MKPRVYIETSIVSYLTARPSNDVRVAAHQNITWEWWEQRAPAFEVFVSEFVLAEAAAGDTWAAQRRLDLLADVPVLSIDSAAAELGNKLVEGGAVPANAHVDAFHIGTAAANGMQYLLTWNCKHIANAARRPTIEALCSREGCVAPIICTPEELLEE